jgi:hypothetical protein
MGVDVQAYREREIDLLLRIDLLNDKLSAARALVRKKNEQLAVYNDRILKLKEQANRNSEKNRTLALLNKRNKSLKEKLQQSRAENKRKSDMITKLQIDNPAITSKD